MIRPQGWERRLSELIANWRSLPFAWGSHDCGTAALAAYEAVMQRRHPRPDSWTNEWEAGRLVHAHTLPGLADRWFGEGVDGWKAARRGDVVLIGSERQGRGRVALAVCIGAQVACPGEAGLEFESLQYGIRTWRVGD